MNEAQEAAMRQALEAIKQFVLKELTVGQRYTNEGQRLLDSIDALTAALADQALDKMAENAREIGLDYEPVAWRYGALLYHDKLDALEFIRTSNDSYQFEPLYTRPQAREPLTDDRIVDLIHAWQAIEETSGHVLDEGDVEGRMHMSVIRSAWRQMDDLVREIWDERGRP